MATRFRPLLLLLIAVMLMASAVIASAPARSATRHRQDLARDAVNWDVGADFVGFGAAGWGTGSGGFGTYLDPFDEDDLY
jgi:hypothetical protein